MKFLKHSSYNKLINDDLQVASSLLPDWYKKIPPKYNEKTNPFNKKTVKACIPFFDSLASGYLITTTQDISLTFENNHYVIQHSSEKNGLTEIEIRDVGIQIPVPFGYLSTFHFAWRSNLILKTPKNHSLLITHPFNRYDLPFITTSGIVDSDVSPMLSGSIPFFLQVGFSGVIPCGTPIAQVFPFKRQSWKHKKDISLLTFDDKNGIELMRTRASKRFYKNNWWVKKSYN